MKKYQFLTLLLFVFIACGRNSHTLNKIEQIKLVGDKDPKLAISMLDSLTHAIREESEYAQMKYDLLSTRLHDKNYDVATSDRDIKRVMEYFEQNGSDMEKQEAYFYTASVYRDLNDNPRALEYFLKSTDVSKSEHADTNLLCNAYSNLSQLYINLKDYNQAKDAALEELNLCHQLHDDGIVAYCHLLWCYDRLDSTEATKLYGDKLLKLCESTPDENVYKKDALYNLLVDFCHINDTTNAFKTYELITKYNEKNNQSAYAYEKGIFFDTFSIKDSAAVYFKTVLNGKELFGKRDALKFLMRYCQEKKEYERAAEYGSMFVSICDTVNLDAQQEQAAMVKNQFQYHHDREAELMLKQENKDYKAMTHTLMAVSLSIILLFIILYVYLKNRQLKKILKTTTELHNTRLLNENLQAQMQVQLTKLSHAESELEQKAEALTKVKEELQKYDDELRQKSKELSERTAQTKQFFNLLHQAELETTAENVVQSIRQASAEARKLTRIETKQFIKAVDEQHPTFKEQIVMHFKKFNEQQQLVFYLLRIGMSKPQIQNLTDIPKVTVWRWAKKYNDLLGGD